MASIKILLNNEPVYSPSEETLKAKGFAVTVQSKQEVPADEKEQQVTLGMLNKEKGTEENPVLEQYLLKVGDRITIVGDFSRD